MFKMAISFTLILLFQINIYANTMSILVDGMEDSREKDSRVGAKVWLDMIFSDGVEKFDIEYLNYRDKAIDYFTSSDIKMLGLNSVIYLENRERLNPCIESMYSFFPTPSNYTQYLLLVRKDSHIKNLKNLKNKTIGIELGSYHTALYLDHKLLEKNLPIHKEYFKNIKYYKNHSKTIMRLFFKKVDACVVSKFTWKLMIEMNPQIEKKITILDKSKKIFLSNIFIINKDIGPKFIKMFNEKISNLKNTPKGKQILTLLKSDRYGKVDQKFLKPMSDFYDEYKKLKENRYGKE